MARDHRQREAAEEPARPTDGGQAEPRRAPAPEDSADAPEQARRAEEAMTSLEKERDELFGRLQRVSADYQNYMRRAEQKLTDAIDLARGDLLKQFVAVLDQFDHALQSEPGGEEAAALHHGMRIVREELLKVMTQAGVERVEPEVGAPFDPHRHEAMLRQPAEGVAPGRITASLAPGYVYKGRRTLRPAKVAVAPETEEEG